jgi:hypothetical protein
MNAQSTFEVSYSVRSQWQDGFVADITIENFGDPIDGWTLSWIFPSDQIRITNLWNGKLTQNGANVTVADAGWNAQIPTNGQVNFGFQASYRGTDVIPSAFSLNGESLSKPTPLPLPAACEVDYQIRSEWNQGFVADLTLHNLGAAVTDWELSWVFPVDGVKITNLWNGRVSQTGREVKVTNLDWNARIATDGEVDLGFQAAYTGGGVTPAEFRLNGAICNGLPATPTPSTTPPPEIPTDAVQILSLTDVDGSALTVGDTLTLTAVAGNAQGQDISSQIQWSNSGGEVLGTGSTLVYAADEVRAETLKASVGSLQARVSFTVSTPEVIVAAHVKVLPDEAEELVESLDLEQGELRLTDSELLPSMLIGDVLIGAAGEVPPVKVSSLDLEEGVWVIGVTAALPKEVIEKGSATFEQTIDWSGESGEVTIVDIPGEPFHIADQLEPKWEGFVQAGDPIETGLKVTASGSLDWKPTYVGSIEFDKSIEDGVKYFFIENISSITQVVRLTSRGLSAWNTEPIEVPLVHHQNRTTIPIGPIFFPIRLDLNIDLVVEPYLTMMSDSGIDINLTYSDVEISENTAYNPKQESFVSSQANWNDGQTRIKVTDINIRGFLALSLKNQLKVLISDQANVITGFRAFSIYTSLLNNQKLSEESDLKSSMTTLAGEIVADSEINIVIGVTHFSKEPQLKISSWLSDATTDISRLGISVATTESIEAVSFATLEQKATDVLAGLLRECAKNQATYAGCYIGALEAIELLFGDVIIAPSDLIDELCTQTDDDDYEACQRLYVLCDKRGLPRSKLPCDDCLTSCIKNKGNWPFNKCPLP